MVGEAIAGWSVDKEMMKQFGAQSKEIEKAIDEALARVG